MILACFNKFIFISDKCEPKDNDRCLQTSPTWGKDFTCLTSSSYCFEYGKDMRRCCPDTCGSGVFTEDDCKQFEGQGTCSYPNDAQSRCARSFLNGINHKKHISLHIQYRVVI